MSNGGIPQWAKQKACDLTNAERRQENFWRVREVDSDPELRALAKYIAETQAADEEDALKALAREIVANTLDEADCECSARDYRSGKEDDFFDIPTSMLAFTLAGIKAGIKHEQERGE